MCMCIYIYIYIMPQATCMDARVTGTLLRSGFPNCMILYYVIV